MSVKDWSKSEAISIVKCIKNSTDPRDVKMFRYLINLFMLTEGVDY